MCHSREMGQCYQWERKKKPVIDVFVLPFAGGMITSHLAPFHIPGDALGVADWLTRRQAEAKCLLAALRRRPLVAVRHVRFVSVYMYPTKGLRMMTP